jgi:hypothetical protein
MMLNPEKVNIIKAALRLVALDYMNKVRDADTAGEKLEAAKMADFAQACAQIADEFETESTRIRVRRPSMKGLE